MTVHALHRLQQRFGASATADDLRQLEASVLAGDAPLIRHCENGREIRDAYWARMRVRVPVVWEPWAEIVVTVLPLRRGPLLERMERDAKARARRIAGRR